MLIAAFIILGTVMLLINIVPFIMAATVFLWIFIRILKFIKALTKKFAGAREKTSEEVVVDKDELDLTGKNIIDVEYREV